MSTLKVTALKNPSSSANNIVLNTDGSMTTEHLSITNTAITASVPINDDIGNVRQAPVTVVTSTPFTIPSGSSGQIFRLQTGSNILNFNSANFNEGDIVTVVNIKGSTKTLSFDDGFFAVRIAADSTNYKNNTLTLAAHGVTTLIAISDTRLMVNGNVS